MTMCGYDTCKYNKNRICTKEDRLLDIDAEDNMICLNYIRDRPKKKDATAAATASKHHINID